MSSLLPLASYNLEVQPYTPTPAVSELVPVTVHITLAAIDPEAIDDEKKPSTLRIIKRNPEYFDDDLLGDFDEDELDDEEDENDEEEDDEEAEDAEAEDAENDEDDDEEENDEDDDEFEEYIVLTLSPETGFQQSIDLTIAPTEEVQFVVTGSYPVYLSGNYVEHPYDNDEDEDDEDDEEDFDEDDYDLTPDEDEILDELDDIEDIEGKIEELVEEDKKRKAEPAEKPAKKAKKEEKKVQEKPAKKEEEKPAKKEEKKDKKKVEFKKDLEQGPTPSKAPEEKKAAKPKVQTLAGGIVVEDRTVGTGKEAKKGSKVGVRYIGKLKNGKVFDKNTNGAPFKFNLGKGEVIKGWDIGVAGMKVGGERRIVIPAPYAYGKQALPGIPANSELTFDVKLVSLK